MERESGEVSRKEQGLDQFEIDQVEADQFSEANVIDRSAYIRWKALSRSKILNEGRNVETSEGEVISLSILPHVLRERTAHLPLEERSRIEDFAIEFRRINGRAFAEKRKAFGIKQTSSSYSKSLQGQIANLDQFKQEIIELYGRMFAPEEVQRVVIEEFKHACSLEACLYFRKKYLGIITNKIEAFKRGQADTRLAIKKGRIEELSWLYGRVKNRFHVTEGAGDREFLLKLLDQFRKETDGDIIKVQGDIDIKIEETINFHVKQEVLSQLNISQLILARVASRMRTNPMRLLKKLNDSVYAKFNGLVGDVADAEYEEVNYPSNQPYDFDFIKNQYKIIHAEDVQVLEEERESEKKAQEEVKEEVFKDFILKKLESLSSQNRAKGASIDQFVLDRKIEEAEKKTKVKKISKSFKK